MANTAIAGVGQELLEVWQQHCYSEFVMKDAKGALTTMSDNSHVLMVTIAVGCRGRDVVHKYYQDYMLAHVPADLRPLHSSRAVGERILAEESVFHVAHDRVLDW